MYPYPTHGGAGPVSGGHRGRQGSVQNPSPLREDQGGKGVKLIWEMPVLGNTIIFQSDIDIGQYFDPHNIDIGQYLLVIG